MYRQACKQASWWRNTEILSILCLPEKHSPSFIMSSTRSTYSSGIPHAGAALLAQSRWNLALKSFIFTWVECVVHSIADIITGQDFCVSGDSWSLIRFHAGVKASTFQPNVTCWLGSTVDIFHTLIPNSLKNDLFWSDFRIMIQEHRAAAYLQSLHAFPTKTCLLQKSQTPTINLVWNLPEDCTFIAQREPC